MEEMIKRFPCLKKKPRKNLPFPQKQNKKKNQPGNPKTPSISSERKQNKEKTNKETLKLQFLCLQKYKHFYAPSCGKQIINK